MVESREKSTAAVSGATGKDRASSQMNSITGYDNFAAEKYTDDETIKQIFKNKQKLVAFREMVIMHIKKNDIATKILSDDLEKQTNDIILPLSSFKQCLKVIGVTLSPAVS